MAPDEERRQPDAGDVAVLVRGAAEGRSQCFDALVERFGGMVWSVARSFRLGDADAADASQVTWLRLVENLDRIREPERVGAWLASTVRHECLRILKKAGRAVPTGLEFDEVVADAPLPGAGVLTAERDAALWRAFGTIPPRCQALLRMLMADPAASYDEVSTVLDMPVGSIGPTRARCLAHLRRQSELAGITGVPSDSE